MIALAQPLYEFLNRYHSDKLQKIISGKLELYTDEMREAYRAWRKTEEGKQYLIGGSKREINWYNKWGT